MNSKFSKTFFTNSSFSSFLELDLFGVFSQSFLNKIIFPYVRVLSALNRPYRCWASSSVNALHPCLQTPFQASTRLLGNAVELFVSNPVDGPFGSCTDLCFAHLFLCSIEVVVRVKSEAASQGNPHKGLLGRSVIFPVPVYNATLAISFLFWCVVPGLVLGCIWSVLSARRKQVLGKFSENCRGMVEMDPAICKVSTVLTALDSWMTYWLCQSLRLSKWLLLLLWENVWPESYYWWSTASSALSALTVHAATREAS